MDFGVVSRVSTASITESSTLITKEKIMILVSIRSIRSIRLMFARLCLLSASLFTSTCFAGEEIPPTREIRIAFHTALTPYAAEREINSIELDIVRESLGRQGCKLVPVFAPMISIESVFNEKSVDGIATANKNTAVNAHFSKAYITFQNVAITLKSRELVIHNVEDLQGYKISAFRGATHYLGAPFQHLVEKNPLYSEESQQLKQTQFLYNGKVDAIIIDRTIFNHLNKLFVNSKFSEPAPLVVMHPVFAPNSHRIGFHSIELRNKFNAGLNSLNKEDIDTIYARNQRAIRFTQ